MSGMDVNNTLYGTVRLPCNFTRYIRAQAKEGDDRRFVAIELAPGPIDDAALAQALTGGSAVFEYIPDGRRWQLVCAPGPDLSWKLEAFFVLHDGRLILEASAEKRVDGRKVVNQWLIAQ